MRTMRRASSDGGMETEGLGLEPVDGERRPTPLAREEMSAAVDGALELVLAAIAVGGASSGTRRVLLEDLIGILDERLRALDREAGLPTPNGAGTQVMARSLERVAVLTTLRRQAVAMFEADPPSSGRMRPCVSQSACGPGYVR